eukprot:816175_1
MTVSNFALGVILNIGGSILINLGTNIVKFAHVKDIARSGGQSGIDDHVQSVNSKNEKKKKNTPPSPQSPQEEEAAVRSSDSLGYVSGEESRDSAEPLNPRAGITPKSFYIGWCLFVVGNVLNFSSFSKAPQSVLSALGSVQFVTNVIFGAAVLKNEVNFRILFSTVAIVFGNVLLVIASTKDDTTFTASEPLDFWASPVWIVYISLVVVLAIVCELSYRKLIKRDKVLVGQLKERGESELVPGDPVSTIREGTRESATQQIRRSLSASLVQPAAIKIDVTVSSESPSGRRNPPLKSSADSMGGPVRRGTSLQTDYATKV